MSEKNGSPLNNPTPGTLSEKESNPKTNTGIQGNSLTQRRGLGVVKNLRGPRPVTVWLRCPHCHRETVEFVDWYNPPPRVSCDGCRRLIPFDMWRVVALLYGGKIEAA